MIGLLVAVACIVASFLVAWLRPAEGNLVEWMAVASVVLGAVGALGVLFSIFKILEDGW